MSDVAVKIKKGTEIELNPEELRKLHEAMSAPGKRKRVIRKVVLMAPILYSVAISDLYNGNSDTIRY